MKIKIRPHDPGMFQEPDLYQMDGWLAELRDHGQARPASDDHAQPARGGDPWPQATAAPEAMAAPLATAEPEATATPLATPAPQATAEPARAEAPAQAAGTVRAVIGDELRMPIMWCEMVSCISWCADPSALGEADARARAISAGWRVDALGRLACPQCQQTDPGFWATSPVVRWDRYTAVARAATACGASTVSQPAPPYPRRWS